MTNKSKSIISIAVAGFVAIMLIIGVVVALQAMNSDDDSESATGSSAMDQEDTQKDKAAINLCEAFSAEEMSKLAGVTVVQDTELSQNGGEVINSSYSSQSQCVYDAKDKSSLVRIDIRMNGAGNGGEELRSVEETYNQSKKGVESTTGYKAIENIGDDAYATGFNIRGEFSIGTIYVLQDKVRFSVLANGFEESADKNKITKDIAAAISEEIK